MLLAPTSARYTRCAKISPVVLGTFVIAVLIVCGFWLYRWSTDQSGSAEQLGRSEYYLFCDDCKEVTTIPAAEARGRPTEDGKQQCPKCNKFAARWVDSPDQAAAEDQNIMAP